MSAFSDDRERRVRDWYRERDWIAFRAPGSLGFCDVIAISVGRRPQFCEVKATHRGPYHGFPPADRRELVAMAEQAGADAVLAWWPRRGKLRFIPAAEWPKA